METLSNGDTKIIDQLARTDVVATLAGLRPFIKNTRWIGKGNFYATDVVEGLKLGPPADGTRKRNLAQYIAAGAVLHTNDGWSYLGRAVSCLMAGDAHRALHLAYYAELRAAISLLAGEGIGIFNNRHYVIDSPNSTLKLNAQFGTHVVAWLALEHWSKQSSSGMLFSRLVRPEGISLDKWFAPVGGSAALAAQAHDWFMQWGMDLSLATEDRLARNESSYRPDGISGAWDIPCSEAIEFVKDLWSVLEPSPLSSFEAIDKYILRLALENQFRAVSGGRPVATNPKFVSYIKTVVKAQNLSSARDNRWVDFLLRSTVSIDSSIFTVSRVRPRRIASDTLAVLSRAVLLLRLATGSTHDLLHQVGFDARSLSFWWKSVGLSRGLWKPSSAPVQLVDLWADIRDTLQEVDNVTSADPDLMSSIGGRTSEMGGLLNMLCSHERVGLWGLCPA